MIFVKVETKNFIQISASKVTPICLFFFAVPISCLTCNKNKFVHSARPSSNVVQRKIEEIILPTFTFFVPSKREVFTFSRSPYPPLSLFPP